MGQKLDSVPADSNAKGVTCRDWAAFWEDISPSHFDFDCPTLYSYAGPSCCEGYVAPYTGESNDGDDHGDHDDAGDGYDAPYTGEVSCDEAARIITGLDMNCPKDCDDCDGDDCDDKYTRCAAGEPERSPAGCKTNACSGFLASITDTAMDQLSATLTSCASHPHYSYFAFYSQLTGPYLKLAYTGIAAQCDLSDQLTLNTDPTTCFGGVKIVAGLDMYCPRDCTDSDDDDCDDKLPRCAIGQPERSLVGCQTTVCADFLSSVAGDHTFDDATAGLASCSSVPHMEAYAAHASIGSTYLRSSFYAVAQQCGLTEQLPTR